MTDYARLEAKVDKLVEETIPTLSRELLNHKADLREAHALFSQQVKFATDKSGKAVSLAETATQYIEIQKAQLRTIRWIGALIVVVLGGFGFNFHELPSDVVAMKAEIKALKDAIEEQD